MGGLRPAHPLFLTGGGNMDILVDIDGTLADSTHRLPLIQGEHQEWDKCFDACDKDAPIGVMCAFVQSLQEQHRVIFVTGRPERIRAKTIDWLGKHGCLIEMPPHLLMRKDGDHRPDFVVKEEMLKLMRIHKYRPRLVIEDRRQVVEMWRRRGLIVLQCAEGDY